MTTINYKIAVLGRDGVGKTRIIIRFVCGLFVEEYDPGIGEDDYRRQISVDDKFYVLDTYGDIEEYPAMRDQYIRSAHGFLLVYSIADIDSFNKIKSYCDEITRVKGIDDKDIPIVLVGAKCDMEDSREVTREQGKGLARQLNCPFFEVSAKNGVCVDDTFTEIVREINAHQTVEPEPEPTKESKKSKFLKLFKRK